MMPAACGLAFSPGDYREPGDPTPDGSVSTTDGSSSGTIGEGGPNGDDAGPTTTRIALFAGRRDALPGETGTQVAIAETMLTSIRSDGTLGPFRFDTPSPTNTSWTRGALVGGEIFLQTNTALVHAPFTDRVSGAWTTATIPPGQPGVKAFVVDAHGVLSGRQLNGTNAQAWAAAFTDAGPLTWLNLGAKTVVDRGNSTLVRAGDNVYIVGGETPEKVVDDGGSSETIDAMSAHAEVEVAKLDANGEPGDFHTTTSLPPVGDSSAFAIFEPVAIASADHVYLLGGLISPASTSFTDTVVATKIKDGATGDLDAWAVLPKLPHPMNQFAAVVTPSWLVVFGGQMAGNKTASTVLRLAIHADGTFGTSWETAGDLPNGGRSAIVGVTY